MPRAIPYRIVYMLGQPESLNGPVKIGITSLRAKRRLEAARRRTNDYSLEVLEQWETLDALYVEKLLRIHLKDVHLGAEWFDVSPHVARAAVHETIQLLATSTKRPTRNPTLFEKLGLSESAVGKWEAAQRRRERNAKRTAAKLQEQVNA